MAQDRSVALEALGPDWATLRRVVADWIGRNRSALKEQLNFPVSDDDLVSFELGAYLYDPTGVTQFDSPYHVTPRESFTFASTGVDGQHYSVLLVPEAFGVVVLTSPMAFETENLVVGASLTDLLCLASRSGLAVVPDLAVIDLERASENLRRDQPANDLLQTVGSELDLKPWADILLALPS